MQLRRGFTLVEMLVALALAVFMMAILSEAFVTGLKAFRQLKAVSDLDQQLRSAVTLLRRDLSANHFEGDRRLSSYTFALRGDGTFDRPELGFFSYVEGSAAIAEGVDSAGRASFRDFDSLHFTIRLNSNRRGQMLVGKVPPGSLLDGIGIPSSRYDATLGAYASQWAEVVYFAVADGRTTSDGSSAGLPLYNLYRRQLLLVPESLTLAGGTYTRPPRTFTPPAPPAGPSNPVQSYHFWYDVSAVRLGGNTFEYNTPADVQFRERRFGGFNSAYIPLVLLTPTPPFSRAGADLLMTNVLSFDVRVLDVAAGDFVDLGYGATFTGPGANPNLPFVYDTWSSRYNTQYDYRATPVPYPVPLQAIMITLRVWDEKTRQARQVTIVQAM